MTTILLSSPCDSLVAKVCANVCACGPKAVEQGANWADVKISETICSNVFWIILALAICFILWKIIDVIAKGISSFVKRKREIEDINRKQKSDLLDLKFKMLKELCDTEEYKKADVEKKKIIYSDVEKYIKAVETALIGENKVEGTTKDDGTE